jgi:putative flippase GtrA
MDKAGRVVVTMPAYFAEQTLEKTYHDIPPGLADEVIVVDDASQDRTVHVARDLGLKVFVHPANRGYGGNQKTCYDQALHAGASIVVLLHPDYQYDPRTLTALIEPLVAGRADFTFGSRFADGADPRQGGMPLYRYVGNKLTTAVENLALGTRFAELHSGLKAYTREFLESHDYHAYSDDFVFDSQMLIDAVLSGARIEEVPIPTRYTMESSSISISRSLRYVLLTFVELWRFKRIYSRRRGARGIGGLTLSQVMRHPELRRIVTFLFAGGASALVTLAVTSLLTDALHLLFLASAIIGTELGVLVNFGINDRQTFSDLAGRRRPFPSRLLRFHLTCALGQSLILISSLLLHDLAHWRTLFAQALPIVVVTAVNFTMHRFWTYRAGRK